MFLAHPWVTTGVSLEETFPVALDLLIFLISHLPLSSVSLMVRRTQRQQHPELSASSAPVSQSVATIPIESCPLLPSDAIPSNGLPPRPPPSQYRPQPPSHRTTLLPPNRAAHPGTIPIPPSWESPLHSTYYYVSLRSACGYALVV